MYLITNRRMNATSGGLEIFDSTPSEEGANNLRIVKVTGAGKAVKAELLDDVISDKRAASLKKNFNLNTQQNSVNYRSLELACLLFAEARKNEKHLLFYVHGYNNNVQDIVGNVHKIEKQYKDLIVVPFSWPAKGGGALSGTANYLDDKRDARVSSGALDRVFQFIREMHLMLLEAQNIELWAKMVQRHGENLMAARAGFVTAQLQECKVTINLLCHSMGNYVLKYATFPSGSNIRKLVFDNVCLVAPDTNNKNHADWVSKIEARGGVYIVINENDYALQWARRKPGDEQKARLGHYLKRLDSPNATYIDVTRATGVGDDHGYYIDKPKLNRMFQKMFTGDRPERYSSQMEYFPELNAYRLK